MKLDGLDNPVSWRYQGAIHGYPTKINGIDQTKFPNRPGDPNQDPNDKFPSDANKFWDLCEHGGWFFFHGIGCTCTSLKRSS